MPEPSKDEPPASGLADRTRDIRLPPVPGSPPVVVRPEWSSYRPQPSTDEAVPGTAQGAEQPEPEVAPVPTPSIADQPTDNLQPPGRPAREKTLTFGPPGKGAMPHPPAAVHPNYAMPRVVAAPRSRRWPWGVLIALPLIVIAVAAVLLLILLRGA